MSVPPKTSPNSTNAIAAAYPRCHQRNPSSYIYNTMLYVACNGPPCVMTYGSEKSCVYPIIVVSATNKNVGPSIGSVTCQNRCTLLAPSTNAASYKSCGIA